MDNHLLFHWDFTDPKIVEASVVYDGEKISVTQSFSSYVKDAGERTPGIRYAHRNVPMGEILLGGENRRWIDFFPKVLLYDYGKTTTYRGLLELLKLKGVLVYLSGKTQPGRYRQSTEYGPTYIQVKHLKWHVKKGLHWRHGSLLNANLNPKFLGRDVHTPKQVDPQFVTSAGRWTTQGEYLFRENPCDTILP